MNRNIVKKKEKRPVVFWDWNGTLLDDAVYAMNIMNGVLRDRGLPLIPDIEYYRSVFCFPVEDYYAKVGITEEHFFVDGHAWMDSYVSTEEQCPLREGAAAALAYLKENGCGQVMLSASKTDFLEKQTTERGVKPYMEHILGLSHIWATSKVSIGMEYMEHEELEPAHGCIIGDTLHDAQVAEKMGIRCVLVTGGHQNRETLETAGVPVEDDILSAAKTAFELIKMKEQENGICNT
ncbi:MAG: hypothetical protein CW338_06725 [Clostridiales bacterium]|nr:hypothetical protein [Clostridiales bacterium]